MSNSQFSKQNNYAFIDSQNLNLGVKSQGWDLDFKKFRIYLREKYNASQAYIFIGYMAGNQNLYNSFQRYGYVLDFKPIIPGEDGKPKGNVDADLILRTMIDLHENHFEKAVIVTSDGDFYSLVDYLYEKDKLLAVLSPNKLNCSVLLRRAAKEKMMYMDNLKERLEYKKSTA